MFGSASSRSPSFGVCLVNSTNVHVRDLGLFAPAVRHLRMLDGQADEFSLRHRQEKTVPFPVPPRNLSFGRTFPIVLPSRLPKTPSNLAAMVSASRSIIAANSSGSLVTEPSLKCSSATPRKRSNLPCSQKPGRTGKPARVIRRRRRNRDGHPKSGSWNLRRAGN